MRLFYVQLFQLRCAVRASRCIDTDIIRFAERADFGDRCCFRLGFFNHALRFVQCFHDAEDYESDDNKVDDCTDKV